MTIVAKRSTPLFCEFVNQRVTASEYKTEILESATGLGMTALSQWLAEDCTGRMTCMNFLQPTCPLGGSRPD